MYLVIKYDYNLTNKLQNFAYSRLCENFAAEYRILQFDKSVPKLPIYQELQPCEFCRLYLETFEPLLDWCEYPSIATVRTGYWLKLPAGVHPIAPAMGSPGRVILEPGATPDRPVSALRQAVLYQAATGCSQGEACRRFGCAQSNFKITRDRMVKRGELPA